MLTAASKFYTEKLSNYFRVKGFNGEEVKTYDIDLSKLEFIVDANGKTWKKGYDEYIKGTPNPNKNTDKKGFKVGTVTIDTAGAGSITQDGNAGAGNLITNTTLGKQAYVTLTKNDKDQVIGINFEDLGVWNQLGDNVDFKSGLKVVNGLQINGSTPIYVYKETDPNKDTVTKFDFADFTGVVAKENEAKVHLYSSNDKDVTAVVIQSSGLAGDTTGQTTQEVVVKSYKKTTDSTPKLAELTVIYQGIETTFTKFASTSEGETPVAGDIYTLVINKDGETVDTLTAVADEKRTFVEVTSVDNQEMTLGATAGLKLASTVAPTIVKFEGGAFVPGTFADVVDASYDPVTHLATADSKQINWSYLEGSIHYVDTIVVTGTSTTAMGTAATTAGTNANTKMGAANSATGADIAPAIEQAEAAIAAYKAYEGDETQLTNYTAYAAKKDAYDDALTELSALTATDLAVTGVTYAKATTGDADAKLAADKTAAEGAIATKVVATTAIAGLTDCTNTAATVTIPTFTTTLDDSNAVYTATVTLICDEGATVTIEGVSVTHGTLS